MVRSIRRASVVALVILGSSAAVLAAAAQASPTQGDPDVDTFIDDPFIDDPFIDDDCLTFPDDPFCATDVETTADPYCSTYPDDPVCNPDFDPLDDPFIDDYCQTFPDDPICATDTDLLDDPFIDDYCQTFPDDPVCAVADEGPPVRSDQAAPPGAPPQPPGGTSFSTTVAARWAALSDLELAISLQNQIRQEIDLLEGLGAYEPVPEQIRLIGDHTAAMGRFTLLRQLPLVETAGALLLEEHRSRELAISDDVAHVLGPLPPPTHVSIQDGATGLVEPGPYVRALSDALYRQGRASTTGDARLPVGDVRDWLASIDGNGSPQPTAAPVAGATPTPEPPDALALVDATGGGARSSALLVGAGLTVVALGGIGVSRRRRPPRRQADAAPGVAALLEASRRLAHTLDEAEVATIAVDEAIRLVDAEAGAFIAVDKEVGLVLLSESPVGLVAPAGLDRSLLSRVGETGQPAHAVITSDTGLTDAPIAVAAVPLVSNGVVTGVLAVGRSSAQPFDPVTVERLSMLAPMAGSALAVAMDHRSVAELASLDGLTGLGNRRALDDDLADATAATSAACFVMIDVDHFKQYNDTHGHAAGDTALRQVAQILSHTVREMDRVYRYGGEEFSVIVPGAHLGTALEVAERIRSAIEAAVFDGEESQPGGRITASLGVACGRAAEPATSVIERADAALYAAKTNGRNRVETAT